VNQLKALYKEFKDAVDPVNRIIERMEVKRQKKRIVEKIMGKFNNFTAFKYCNEFWFANRCIKDLDSTFVKKKYDDLLSQFCREKQSLNWLGQLKMNMCSKPNHPAIRFALIVDTTTESKV